MQSIKQMKEAHAMRMTVTAQDEYFYKEPEPLTEEQKSKFYSDNQKREMLWEEEKKFRAMWMEKYYADKTNRDLLNW